MFGVVILDTKLAILAVLLTALMDGAIAVGLSRWVPWSLEGVSRWMFIGRRLSLAVTFSLGVVAYSWLKDIYLSDPFFTSLYVFLVAFFLFYHLVGLSAVVAAFLTGSVAVGDDGRRLHLVSLLVLLAVVVAKPQVSTLGFMSGSLARFSAGFLRRKQGLSRFLLLLGIGLFLFLLLTMFSL